MTYKYNGSEPDPVFDDNGDNPSWDLVTNEFYVRDITGKEIAIYNGSSLTQWNVWGLDNVGKINADTTRNYYLKDHLGSIRVVLNSTNTVVSAQDYDAWGYVLENRTYNSAAMKYDFTGKERDNETNYEYFGARYYDSRIGRWGGVEPKYDIYLSWTPYNYSLNNPLNYIDVNGLEVIVTGEQSRRLVEELNNNTNLNVKIDDNGKLTATGEPENQMEFVLIQAINSDITINLITTNQSFVMDNGIRVDMIVDYFAGSNITENGDVVADQYINLNQADVWEKAGGSNVSGTIMHAVNEAFIGAVQNPGSNYNNTTKDVMKEKYDRAHNIIRYIFEAQEEKQYYPGYTIINRKIYLVDEDNRGYLLNAP